jgi:hypothetical protein
MKMMEQISPRTLPYFDQLVLVRRFLEQDKEGNPAYPRNGCQDATRLINYTAGLEEYAGWFIYQDIDLRKLNLDKCWHAWNYDAERRLYIDLSMDQFGVFRSIEVLPEDTSLLEFSYKNTSEQFKLNSKKLIRRFEGFRQTFVPKRQLVELVAQV